MVHAAVTVDLTARPACLALGLGWTWVGVLSVRFFNPMCHKWRLKVAWGHAFPSAFQGQRTLTPHQAVPPRSQGAVGSVSPRAPSPLEINGVSSAFPSQVPSECLGKRYLAREERLCTAFSVLYTVTERGKESPPGDTRGALLKGPQSGGGQRVTPCSPFLEIITPNP